MDWTLSAKFMLVVYCRMRAYTHTLDELETLLVISQIREKFGATV